MSDVPFGSLAFLEIAFLRRSLSALSIRARIVLLACAALAGVGAMGFAHHLVRGAVSEAMTASRQATDLQAKASSLRVRIANLRTLHRDFAIARDERSASLFEATLLATQLDFVRLRDQASAPEIETVMSAIIGRLDDMMREFSVIRARQLELGANETEALNSRLHDLGQSIERAIHADGSGNSALVGVAVEFFKIRHSMAEIRNPHHDAAHNDVTPGVARLRRLLDINGFNSGDMAGAHFGDVINEYLAMVEEWTRGTTEVNRRFADFDKRIESIVPDAVQFVELAQNRFDAATSALASKMERASALDVFISLSILLGMVLASIVLARSITRPLAQIRAAMDQMANGVLDGQLPAESKSELGDMARALRVFRDGLIERARMVDDNQLAALAQAERAQIVDREIDAFDAEATGAIDAMREAASSFETAADELTRMAASVTHETGVAASASEQAASNTSLAARAAEHIAQAITEVSDQASVSTAVARRAVAESRETQELMRSLANSANQIGDVSLLIRAVAGQTNLLALNATIEAARAGEAGRGFAVVANEVKTLAARTGNATDEIERLVDAIRQASSAAASSIDHMSGTIDELTRISMNVATAVEEQSAAVATIADNVSQTAALAENGKRAIASVSGAAEQARGTADGVAARAKELRAKTGRLQQEITHFLAKVRAA